MSYPENSAILSWLALEEPEPVLEPHLPIIDPHHHLWDLRSRGAANSFEQQLYLCEDLVAELRGGGHNVVRSRHRPVAQRARTLRPGATVVADGWVVIARPHSWPHSLQVQTVFLQCGAFHRADGPPELKPVGETEFVHGISAMSASGVYGPARLCTGIVGTAELGLGKAATDRALAAHAAASPHFRGKAPRRACKIVACCSLLPPSRHLHHRTHCHYLTTTSPPPTHSPPMHPPACAGTSDLP